MITIILIAAVIVLGTSTAVTYQAYIDTYDRYEYAEDRLELERTKNKVLQEENATLTDHVGHLNQNLEQREDGE